MKRVITKLSKAGFNETSAEVLFNSDNARAFGVFEAQSCKFKLDWESDLIIPEVYDLGNEFYTIGIDQNFAIVDVGKCAVKLSVKLGYFYVETIVVDETIFVITELAIIKISKVSLQILKIEALPDIYQECLSYKNGILQIKCFGDIFLKFQA
jgi:hypothetical protein